MAKKSKDESAKPSSKSERRAGEGKGKSSRKGSKSKAKRETQARSESPDESPEPVAPSAATSGEALQEWVEGHAPSSSQPVPVAAVGAFSGATAGDASEPGAPRELALGDRYLVDRAVARALRPALLVLLVVAFAALWWGNRLREDRDVSRGFAAQTELDAANVRSGRNEVANLVDSVEASRREVERLKLELLELSQRASEERERAGEERRAAERALALAREYALEAEAHARSAEGQTVAQQMLVDRQGENAEQLAALSAEALSTSDALGALLDTARQERTLLADELAAELVAEGRLTEAVAGQLSAFWDASARPWTERIDELEAVLASSPVELRQTRVRLRWNAAASDREATLALAVRPAGASDYLPLGEATFGAPSTYLVELAPRDAGTLLGAPWWTMEPTGAERTPDFERLSWTPVERDGAHLARLEATLASPDFSGELEFTWFALIDRRTAGPATTE